jgi:hypothetical protein
MSGMLMERLRRTAKSRAQRIALAEPGDDRVVRAADRLAREGLARVQFIGPPDEVRATARKGDVHLPWRGPRRSTRSRRGGAHTPGAARRAR